MSPEQITEAIKNLSTDVRYEPEERYKMLLDVSADLDGHLVSMENTYGFSSEDDDEDDDLYDPFDYDYDDYDDDYEDDDDLDDDEDDEFDFDDDDF